MQLSIVCHFTPNKTFRISKQPFYGRASFVIDHSHERDIPAPKLSFNHDRAKNHAGLDPCGLFWTP